MSNENWYRPGKIHPTVYRTPPMCSLCEKTIKRINGPLEEATIENEDGVRLGFICRTCDPRR